MGGYEQLPIVFLIEVCLIVLFTILTCVFFIIWIYKDCKARGEGPLMWILWVFLMLLTSPFLGIIIYLIVRKEKKYVCKSCGNLVSSYAKYCETCGVTLQNENDIQRCKQNSSRKYMIAGISSFAMIFVIVVVAIITGLIGFATETNVKSEFEVWNSGFETFSTETNIGNNWNLTVKSASKGFIKEAKMEITNPEEQVLYLDATCELKEEDGNLILWLVQGDTTKSVDITKLSETLEYPLDEFKEGKIFVRVQINNVKNVKVKASIE